MNWLTERQTACPVHPALKLAALTLAGKLAVELQFAEKLFDGQVPAEPLKAAQQAAEPEQAGMLPAERKSAEQLPVERRLIERQRVGQQPGLRTDGS